MRETERQSRLRPAPHQPSYLLLRCLATQMAASIERHLPPDGRARVLDVGCGDRPYEPLFTGRVATYVGLDARPGPGVDITASSDALPVPDESYDCVLSSQVIEHVPEPERAVTEMHRVLRPGGLLLLSTHGVARYHPNPDDYWRWTHVGLIRLIESCGLWRSINVSANGGPGAALAYLAGVEGAAAASAIGLQRLFGGLMTSANVVAWAADRAVARRNRGRLPGLSPNYLLTAVRA